MLETLAADAPDGIDAVKSRQKPICDIEIGFNSALPCLLAIVSVKTGRTVRWDGKAART